MACDYYSYYCYYCYHFVFLLNVGAVVAAIIVIAVIVDAIVCTSICCDARLRITLHLVPSTRLNVKHAVNG